ncbi:MAG TPA: sigma-70 family RNA polymerase sigma factor [Flavobacteriales bacterium]|nr:sigma-70 family RNA polymerase sigma factor [Flavobacteriales bacterium]HMR28690.1 sigma-70 family RNA polymerase sigma factor [Flavobacteriales bacterium]
MREEQATSEERLPATWGNDDMAALVKQYTRMLLSHARARLNDQTLAEDLVQQTFLAAWEGRTRFAGESSPRTWLFSILKNKIADHYRKHYRDPQMASMDPEDVERFDSDGRWLPQHRPTDWQAEDAEDKETLFVVLANCLDKLPETWRAAVEMKYLKECDAAAICQELGLSATHYWQQIHRAKLRLRACMENGLHQHTA